MRYFPHIRLFYQGKTYTSMACLPTWPHSILQSLRGRYLQKYYEIDPKSYVWVIYFQLCFFYIPAGLEVVVKNTPQTDKLLTSAFLPTVDKKYVHNKLSHWTYVQANMFLYSCIAVYSVYFDCLKFRLFFIRAVELDFLWNWIILVHDNTLVLCTQSKFWSK